MNSRHRVLIYVVGELVAVNFPACSCTKAVQDLEKIGVCPACFVRGIHVHSYFDFLSGFSVHRRQSIFCARSCRVCDGTIDSVDDNRLGHTFSVQLIFQVIEN